VVKAASWLVPADARSDWRRQWLADLHFHRDWLLGSGRSPVQSDWELLRRAAGAGRHAAWMRWRHWRTNMAWQDLKHALRSLMRRPGFSGVVVLTLALGIGANVTIFSWIDALVFNPLPGVEDVGSLVVVHGTTKTRPDLSVSYPNFRDLQAARPDGFAGFVASRSLALAIRVGAGEPERTWAEVVSGNYFDLLSVRPQSGRLLMPSDDGAEGTGAVAVISDRLWKVRFASAPGVVGTAVTINGRPFEIVGVAAPGFKGAVNGLAADLWLPMSMQPVVSAGSRLQQRGNAWLAVLGRLGSGVSRTRAQASISAVATTLQAIDPVNQGVGLGLSSIADDGAGQVLVPVMTIVMGVVAVVLVIACANIAGLMLSRGAARRRDVAIRLAIGSSRWQIVRGLLMESLVLAAAGGVAGLGLANASSALLGALLPPLQFQVLIPSGITPRVLAVAVLAIGASTLLFGLVPALQASQPRLVASLRDEAGTTGGPRKSRLRRLLVVSQVAMALLLLVGAGLFARTLSNAQRIDPGFRERRALLASIDVAAAGYDSKSGAEFYRQLVERLEATPGVRHTALTTQMPLSIGGGSDTSPKIEGYSPAKDEGVTVYYSRVSSHYFDALRLPIVAGRSFDDREGADGPLAVVINETMARRYWKGRDPVGGRLDYGSGWVTVVGIAADGKYGSVSEAPRSFMYLPLAQSFRPAASLVIATVGDPSSMLPGIRRVMAGLNPNVPLFEVRTLEEHVGASVFLPRLALMLLGAFGGLALLLAVIGLYGVVAYGVTMRTREIGVRMALGAGQARIRREVLGQGVKLAGVGLAAGFVLSLVAAPLLASQLVGVRPTDALVLASTSALLLVVSSLASWIPAWRASRIDPIRALRCD
jgi:predicted permease